MCQLVNKEVPEMEGRLESLSAFITAEYRAELKVNILRFSRTEQASIESMDLVCC